MSILRLTAKYESLAEQLNHLKEDINGIHLLIENVEYSPEQENGLANVGMKYLSRASELEDELFTLRELLEVHRLNDSMESDTALH